MNQISEVDVSPYSTLASEIRHQQQAVMDYSQRIKVVVITFIIVFFIGLSYVWLQYPVYQSSALLRFSYPKAINAEQNATVKRDFSVSEYRLTSQSTLSLLRESLDTQGMMLTMEELSAMLDSKVDAGERLVYLYAIDKTSDNLVGVMNTWMSLYLTSFESQHNDASVKDKELTEKKLVELEGLIQQQRDLLQQFREANDIVFLEKNKNIIFNKMNTVVKQLSETESTQTELTSQLAAINQASRDGIDISNPATKVLIRKTQLLIQTQRNELDVLSRRYTQKYMQKDPVIVEKSRRLTELETTLQEQQVSGAIAYKHETSMQLTKAKLKIDELLNQRRLLKGDIQAFSTQLAQYKSMALDLQHLEKNQQKQKEILLDISLTQPLTPRIDILESPVTPSYPIGPNYWFNSGIAFIVSLLSSVFALIIFKLIAIKRLPAATSYTVVQPQNNFIESSSTKIEECQVLTHTKEVQALAVQTSLMEEQVFLNEQQSQILLAHTSDESEISVKLIYCGVTPEELLTLTVGQIDMDSGLIHLTGRFQRSLVMPTTLKHWLQSKSFNHDTQALLTTAVGKESKLDELSKSIQQAAREAKIANAEQIDLDCLRHSYLMFLALQGIRLNEIEQIAGYIPPNQLSKYKGKVASNNIINLSEINPIHSALRSTSY